MFNSIESTPSHRVTTRQPQHHSHRCPLFQVQRKAPTSPKSKPSPNNSESKSTDFTDPHVGHRQAATSRITPCYPISQNSGSTNYPSVPTLEQRGDPLEPELPQLSNPHLRAPVRPSDRQNPTHVEPKLPLKLYTHPTPSKGRIRQNRFPKPLLRTRQVYSQLNFTRNSLCARFSYCTRS
jgi:hypothetical protein